MPGAKESSSICKFVIGALLESQAIPLCTSRALVFKGSAKFDSHIRSHTPVAALQCSGPLWPELNCAVILGTARVTLNVQLTLLRLPVISGACIWSLAAGGSHSACTGRCGCIGASQVAGVIASVTVDIAHIAKDATSFRSWGAGHGLVKSSK